MDLQIFALLLGLLIFLPWYWFINKRFPEAFDKYASRGDQFKAGMLVLGGMAATGYLVYRIAPPLYRYLLNHAPLLLARVLTIFAWLFFVVLAVVLVGAFLRLLARLPERWQAAETPDMKLFNAVGLVAFGLLAAGSLYVAGAIGVALFKGWSSQSLWAETIQQMGEVQSFEESGKDEHRIENSQIMIAQGRTCLSANKGGGCDYILTRGDHVVSYMTLDGIVTEKVVSLRQQGEYIYVISFSPDSMFETGWIKQTAFQSTTDLLSAAWTLLKSIFSPVALKSFGIDLLIGGAVTVIIVLLTRGSLEEGILFLIFLFSMLSMILRYMAGRLIPPVPLLMVAFLPFALGSVIEEWIIKAARRFGF